jgi:Protein of unknown function (DUF3617)
MSIKPSIAFVLICAGAWAADYTPLEVKTGVWESTITTQTSGLPQIPDSILSKMSADQRSKMEAAMKGRGGGQPAAATHRYCVKKEDLTKPLFEQSDNRTCKTKLVDSSSSKREIQIDCEAPQGKGNGTILIEARDSENVKITSRMTIRAGANTMTSNATGTAKWIGATCTGNEK